MTSLKNSVVVFAFLILNSAFAHAQSWEGPSFLGPVATAMGGAGRAAFDPGESAYLNPSSISSLRSYFGSAYYSTQSHPDYGHSANYGVLLADGNSDGLFAGAAGYTHNQISAGPGHDSSEDFFVSGAGYLIPNLALGVSGHYVMDTFQTGNRQNQINGTVGLMYSVSEDLAFGLVGQNLAGSHDGVPDRDQLVPSYGGGVTYFIQKILQYRLDIEYPDQLNPHHRPNVMTGFESSITKAFALRAGWRWQESDLNEGHYMSLGFGIHTPKVNLDYAFQKDLLVAGGTRHVVDLWMPF